MESGEVFRISLVLPDGNTLELAGLDFQKIVYKDIPQGGGVVHQIKYYYDHGTPDSDVQQPASFWSRSIRSSCETIAV